MNYYIKIKQALINNETYKKVKDYSKNRSDLRTYYNVGKLLSEAGKHYGEGIIQKYSLRLTKELGKGYSVSNLKNMRKFYEFSKSQTVSGLLSWSHYNELLKLDDNEEINYYIKECEDKTLSVRQLRERVKNKEYQRLPNETKLKLIEHKENRIADYIKNLVLIKNKYDTKNISEKMLQQLILEDISNFLKELGTGFCFIESEYSIRVGNRYNYIDLLLFNIKDNRYVVVELKVTELKKEHIGQIQIYMNYIDQNIKDDNQNPTLGIIICKKGNKFIMEYVSSDNILEREYYLI